MPSIDHLLLGAALLLLLSVVASKTSGRSGVPVLLFFLAIGMLAGSDGPGGIYFDDPWLAQSLGVVALVVILFAGGLDTDWRSVRPVLHHGLGLATFGVLLTALCLGGFVSTALGYPLVEGLLLGAIVSSTDAAAVFAVLRSRNVGLRGHLKPLLELESGSNDPMAVFLTTGLIHLITTPAASMAGLLPGFVVQMGLGAAAGYGLGRLTILAVNRIRLEYEGLYPVLTLSLVLLTYGATATIGGNGFLAVYVAGLVVGNHELIHRNSLMRFHDGLAWLMQIAMFLTLGLLVFPSRLLPIAGVGLVVSLFLMLVARPLSVLLVLSLADMPFREKLLVAWVGLRGAVPIVLATFPLLAGVPRAEALFNLVFFVVLTSVLLQGTSIPRIAQWLGVDAPIPAPPRGPVEAVAADARGSVLTEFRIPERSAVVGRQVVDLGLPDRALIVLIKRKDDVIVPGGGTVIEADDALVVLCEPPSIEGTRRLLGAHDAPG
ncbi:MAG: potassium/proton antiporter [Candidatus Rokuibacteriota bacterium]